MAEDPEGCYPRSTVPLQTRNVYWHCHAIEQTGRRGIRCQAVFIAGETPGSDPKEDPLARGGLPTARADVHKADMEGAVVAWTGLGRNERRRVRPRQAGKER